MFVTLSFFMNYTQAIKEQKRVALETGKSFFELILISRMWNSLHGGVYAPVTEKLKPNPYLKTPMRDIHVNKDLTLTMINPAFMTRQLSEIAIEKRRIQFHITSLNPIRPENSPSEREKQYLKAFEKGIKEVGISTDRGSSFFYMGALTTEKTCLGCHAEQGYKQGDIRGGISITFPFTMDPPIFFLLMGHLMIGAAGLCCSIIFGSRLGKAYTTIQQQALIDALTEIPNRRSFMETISRELKRSHRLKKPLSIILCDIDNFKLYNDTYGHSRGDRCLKRIALGIKNTLTRPVDFCARYGGEEFVVLLPETSMKGAGHVAEKICLSIHGMNIAHERSLPFKAVTISLGVSTLDGAAFLSSDELLKNADMALYKAKENGRNRVELFNSPVV